MRGTLVAAGSVVVVALVLALLVLVSVAGERYSASLDSGAPALVSGP